MAFNIAFVGYDTRQSISFFRQLAEDNREQIRICQLAQGRIVLMDGTTIIRAQTTVEWLKGRRFDQIIVADDRRGMVQINQINLLCALEEACRHSIVPGEFRCIFYCTDEEVTT